MFKYFKYKLLERRWEKILKNSHFNSWDTFLYWDDPDMNYFGNTPEESLCGFNYIIEVPFEKLDVIYTPMFGPMYSSATIEEWCKNNCKDKVRWVFSTKFKDHMDQYKPFPQHDTDIVSMGFKNEKDFFWFSMKWQ
jgi:hypothetical protein